MNKSNYFWMLILFASLGGIILLINSTYSNTYELPNYAFLNSQLKEAYIFAKMFPDKLDGIPCYCGCMQNAGGHGRLHSRGLIDCFIEGDLNNGGKWDKHASECVMCYEDALTAKKLYTEGKSKIEIKNILKEKYEK